jgi:ribose 5-phosphate isomerase A
MDAKMRAAEAALRHVRDGMVVGLGSGSTASLFIEMLCKHCQAGKAKGIRGVPTSVNSERLAREGGLPVIDLLEAGECDVTIDGADEVDPKLDLIKGLGGALLREKIVAQNTRKMIVIVDESKIVPYLGHHCPLPVEVIQFAHEVSERYLRELGSVPEQRRNADGSPFVSDNGNYYYHCQFGPIHDPAALDRKLRSRAGIVETGLFVGRASVVIVAGKSGVRELVRS